MASSWPRDRRLGDGVRDVVVAANEPVVVRELVLAIRRDERGAIGVVAGVAAEHREQRNADPGQPLLVRRARPVELLERVTRRVENQLDRVDERSVEVEEDGSGRRCGAGDMDTDELSG